MLGEESTSADYWEKCGQAALRHGVKHIIIMVSCNFLRHTMLDGKNQKI